MEITKEQLVEHLGQMTVMEMCNLIHDLEEEWGVSATPQLQAQTTGGPPPVEEAEQTEFDVELVAYGEKKVNTIRVLRAEIVGLGLREAKELAEAAPTLIKEGISKEEAENLKAKLEEVGAKVNIK